MTTLVRPAEQTDGGRSAGREAPEPGRLAAWRSTWAVALRMARRDVRRHRGRSALVIVMVALPTLLLALLVTVVATSDIDGVERIPSTMGSGQALVEWPEGGLVMQGPDPSAGASGTGEGGREIPGFDRERTAFDNADAISRLVGAPVTPVASFSARITLGERRITVEALALDGRTGLGDRLRLESGRWPVTSSEALVTRAATSRGVPSQGRVTVSVNGTDRTYDVVGTARTAGPFGSEGLVVPVPPADLGQASSGGWIVRGADPVTWDEVRVLNEYGLRVTSRAVLHDPPSTDGLAPEIQDMARGDATQMGLLVGLGLAMLLATTALLVGPAFAVSAARQRRTLALAASNGASTAVLRRTVLAQAVVLGTFSALVGTVLGVLGSAAVVAWTTRTGDLGLAGPFDIRWGLLGGIAACAVASTLVAALVPARRLGRLDIVGVMRGQSVSARPSRLVLAAGLVLTAVGTLAVLGSTGVAGLASIPARLGLDMGGEFAVVAGDVVLITGTLLLVPAILTVVGRLGSHLPTSLRMAARDLARHRSRSAPSVAAVLAAVASMAFGLTGLASDTEQARRQYMAQTLPGEAVVSFWYHDAVDPETVKASAPGLVVTENLAFDTKDPSMTSAAVPTEPYRVEFVNVLAPGCTPERTIMDLEWVPSSEAEADQGPPCMVAGTTASGSGLVMLLPADEIARRLGLDAAQGRALREGGVVARGLPSSAVTNGHVTLLRGSYETDPRATVATDPKVEVAERRDVPVITVPGGQATSGAMLDAPLLVPSDGPLAKDWPTRTSSLTVRDPSGAAVQEAVAERLALALGDEVSVTVERGFERDDALVVAILLGTFALLVLVITLTSTALTLAEQQSDQATLAALGATRGTRRVMAAAQAFLLAAVGCVLGVAVGLVPGIAIARPLTTNGWTSEGVPAGQDTVLVIPWEQLAVVAILVPVLAAAIAAAGIRRAPQVTRRAT